MNTAQSRTPKRDKLIRKIRDFKSWVFLTVHGIFYKTLFKLKIGWKFNQWLCKSGWYRRFPDGRCMYCGGLHHWEKIR